MGRPPGDTLKWFNAVGCRRIPLEYRSLNPLELMREGYSSADIALFQAVPEAQIYNEIHRLREAEYSKGE